MDGFPVWTTIPSRDLSSGLRGREASPPPDTSSSSDAEPAKVSRAWIRLSKLDSIKPTSSSPRLLGSIEMPALVGRGAWVTVSDGHGKEQEEGHQRKARNATSRGHFVPKPLVGGFGCLELVLYSIRELA